jgi:hypothetical protein
MTPNPLPVGKNRRNAPHCFTARKRERSFKQRVSREQIVTEDQRRFTKPPPVCRGVALHRTPGYSPGLHVRTTAFLDGSFWHSAGNFADEWDAKKKRLLAPRGCHPNARIRRRQNFLQEHDNRLPLIATSAGCGRTANQNSSRQSPSICSATLPRDSSADFA